MTEYRPSPEVLIGDSLVEELSQVLGRLETALEQAGRKPDSFDEIAVAALLWMAAVCGFEVVPVERMVDKIRTVHAELKELSEPYEALQ